MGNSEHLIMDQKLVIRELFFPYYDNDTVMKETIFFRV